LWLVEGYVSLKTFHIRGRVFSGKREGSKYIELPSVKRQITEKLGFIPYSGTLNLRLAEDDVLKLAELLKEARQVEISRSDGSCRGKCYEARLAGNLKCAIIVPEVPEYPENVMEVIASAKLREKLQLEDSDTVEVMIEF
jgi:riboflavin kinase